MIPKQTFFILTILMLSQSLFAADVHQWRGPNRDGIYPEKNLLKKWPEKGSQLLWKFEGLGEGHSTVTIVNRRIYTTGMIDSMGYVFALEQNGSILWKKQYGREWTKNYPGSRSTPTIVDGRLYLLSSLGRLLCLNTENGDEYWTLDIMKQFGAKQINWGMTESLLIDNERVFCTPGGIDANVVALNRFTGKTIWTSKGNGEPSAYCSPILVRHGKKKLIVTMTAESVLGIDAETGTCYWHLPQHQQHKIHANSPVYRDGYILCASSYDKTEHSGTALFKLSKEGTQAELVWRNDEFKNLMGGVIVTDGFIYGSNYRSGGWKCLDWQTGTIQYTTENFGLGAMVYADGLFYCYSEKGDVGLVKATQQSFEVISSFKITEGTGVHWAHPVISDGRLYIRHGDVLLVYSIQE
ncbi:PQQ-like beta-propeller repeat protein [candidate division KSB1 bacterium]|nr:PQQ-like beta-propeller repeat protein [candidate division KSB1 bacterium]